jgi:hypothetical protein
VTAKTLSKLLVLGGAALLVYLAVVLVDGTLAAVRSSGADSALTAVRSQSGLVARGRQIFRFDTFGDQAFWGGSLQLHGAIEGAKNGGSGPA